MSSIQELAASMLQELDGKPGGGGTASSVNREQIASILKSLMKSKDVEIPPTTADEDASSDDESSEGDDLCQKTLAAACKELTKGEPGDDSEESSSSSNDDDAIELPR